MWAKLAAKFAEILIPIAIKGVTTWLEYSNASKEAKKWFSAQIEKYQKNPSISVKLRESYAEQLKRLNDDAPGEAPKS